MTVKLSPRIGSGPTRPAQRKQRRSKMTRKLNIILGSMLVFLSACASNGPATGPSKSTAFDYSKLIALDANALCEFGIEEAFANLKAVMEQRAEEQGAKSFEYHSLGSTIVWRGDSGNPDAYLVSANYESFLLFSPDKPLSNDACAERAAGVFFHIVNAPLWKNDAKFHAFYSGPDLLGGYLTPDEVEHIKSANPNNKTEWPYLPMCYTKLPEDIDRFNLYTFRRKFQNELQPCPSPV